MMKIAFIFFVVSLLVVTEVTKVTADSDNTTTVTTITTTQNGAISVQGTSVILQIVFAFTGAVLLALMRN